MSNVEKKMNFFMTLVTETRKIKADLGIANKWIPALYITPIYTWQLEIIQEMKAQIIQMCKVENVLIVHNSDKDLENANVYMSENVEKPLKKITPEKERNYER